MRRDYELGFILHPEVSEEQTRAILDRIHQIVANHGGQVVKVNQWGRRRLAYPIQRNRDGFYVFIDMILTPETLPELDRTLKVSEEVLRHMVKRRDPKAVQQERQEREEREARAAAAAAAQEAAAQEAAQQEAEAAPVAEQPQAEGEEAGSAAPAAEAEVEEAPATLSAEETENVPPASEETTSEA